MIQGSVSKGWLHKEAGFTFPREYYFDPVYRRKQDREIHAFLDRRFPDIPLYHMESNLVQAEFARSDQLMVGGLQPNLILGAMLGAELVFPEGADADIRGLPLERLKEAGELPPAADLLSRPPVPEFLEQLERCTKDFGSVPVIPPFFWDLSCRATIHGFITTAFKFCGQAAFIMLFENPDLLTEVHRWIDASYAALIALFAPFLPAPVSGIHIGECSGALVSAEDFTSHILPWASGMGRRYGRVRFHSCGDSDHLLESIAAIENLHALDTGSGTSAAKARRILGPGITLELAPPVELLVSSSAEKDIAAWLDLVLAENQGGPLRIGYHLEPGYNFDAVMLIHKNLEKRGIVRRGRTIF
ncbi:MAG: hypothetical protein E4H36_10935 [Spirochaetales bacterium]|nr:MAG: hypothetical protein E4H36_10935 [Spirochaetales bacterium]